MAALLAKITRDGVFGTTFGAKHDCSPGSGGQHCAGNQNALLIITDYSGFGKRLAAIVTE
jgi:hypothetical protein